MNNNIKEKIDIALEIYKDISRQIQFADTKAGLILAWHAASLGFLIKILLDTLSKIPEGGLKILILFLFLITVILAGLSIVFAFNTVYPGLKDTGCIRECMFWAYHISCGEFERDVKRFKENLNELERILNCLSRSVVIISKILKKKYSELQKAIFWLKLAIWIEVFLLLPLLLSNL